MSRTAASAWAMPWRRLRVGELRILIIAVAVITFVRAFADRVEQPLAA